jgi:hypothetical protein
VRLECRDRACGGLVKRLPTLKRKESRDPPLAVGVNGTTTTYWLPTKKIVYQPDFVAHKITICMHGSGTPISKRNQYRVNATQSFVLKFKPNFGPCACQLQDQYILSFFWASTLKLKINKGNWIQLFFFFFFFFLCEASLILLSFSSSII